MAGEGDQLHFHPETYPDLIRQEVPEYDRLQDEVVAATRGMSVRRALELGVGTGVTTARFLGEHPGTLIVGIDESEPMLAHARPTVPAADLRVARLEDALPGGPFDVVYSALAVHHLDGSGKAHLFRRITAVLAPGGRFVLGDVIVPDDPADVVAPIDPVYDTPSRVDEQLEWLTAAGFAAKVTWANHDLAVMVGDLCRA